MPHPFYPAVRNYSRKRKMIAGQAPLELMSVSYDMGSSVTLFFNQPITVEWVDVTMFTVNDPSAGARYVGGQGASQDSPESVRITLSPDGSSQQGGTFLDVQPGNGVQTLDGGEWSGVTEWVIS
jgi:hypothetical protein